MLCFAAHSGRGLMKNLRNWKRHNKARGRDSSEEKVRGAIGLFCIVAFLSYTSRAFDIATKDLAPLAQPGGPFFGIHASNDGRIMIFAGGIPLKRDGTIVGAIGVSGGSGEQDHAVAEA